MLRDARRINFTIVENEVVDSEDLSIYEKMVYIVLCRHTRESQCFPSYQTIGKKAGCSRRKAINAIASLEEKGLIIKEIRKNEKQHSSNMYTVVGMRGEQDSTGVVSHRHPGDEQNAPEQDLLNKTNSLSQSVSKKETDGQTKPKKKNNELEQIMDQAQIHLFDAEHGKALKVALIGLWHAEQRQIQGTVYSQAELRSKIRELTLEAIDHALWKLRQVEAAGTEIKNRAKYLQSVIITAIDEAPAAMI